MHLPIAQPSLQWINRSGHPTKIPPKTGFFSHFLSGRYVVVPFFFAAKMGKLKMFKNLTIHLVETTSVDKLWRWKSKLPHLFFACHWIIDPRWWVYLFWPCKLERMDVLPKKNSREESQRLGWLYRPIPITTFTNLYAKKRKQQVGRWDILYLDSRWWFEMFSVFTPTFGYDPNGLKPPTSDTTPWYFLCIFCVSKVENRAFQWRKPLLGLRISTWMMSKWPPFGSLPPWKFLKKIQGVLAERCFECLKRNNFFAQKKNGCFLDVSCFWVFLGVWCVRGFLWRSRRKSRFWGVCPSASSLSSQRWYTAWKMLAPGCSEPQTEKKSSSSNPVLLRR